MKMRLLALFASVFLVACAASEPDVAELESAVINNPTDGGPFGSYVTYQCSSQPGAYLYNPGCPGPLTTSSQVVNYLNNAARNWGCPSSYFTQPVVAVPGGFSKRYGVSGNASACGMAYWNTTRQAAFFVPNADRQCSTYSCDGALNGTSRQLLVKYQALATASGALGLPISNPIPYNGGTTLQLFTNGFITYRSGGAAAFYAGGTSVESQSVARRYLDYFGVSPYVAAPVYGLAADIANTCLVAGQTGCTSIDDTGDFIRYRDLNWNLDAYVVARTGWTTAHLVHSPIYAVWNDGLQPPIYNGGTPWSGSTLGFPLGDLVSVGTAANGQPIQLQQFERGTISWQPKTCETVQSCPAAGSTHCSTYGTLSTNYVAIVQKQSSAPLMAGDSGSFFCPVRTGTQIAPLCDSTQWIRYSNEVSGRFTCDSPVAFPSAITLRIWNPSTAETYERVIPREIYKGWLAGGDVERALSIWGAPGIDHVASTNALGDINYQDFPNGRVYAGRTAGAAVGVHGKIWELYASLGAHLGPLGFPITAATSLTSYPRYQYFQTGLIDAQSSTSATWTSTAYSQCTDSCSSPSHIVSETHTCWFGSALTTCGDFGAARGDADLDDIPDALEAALIARFRPTMHGTLDDRYQAYGVSSSVGGSVAPAVVRFYNGSYRNAPGSGGRGFNCGLGGEPDGAFFEDKRCIEIVYATPYNWDLGAQNAHRGDSELVTVLVARRDPWSWNVTPSWTGSSWAEASTDASRWKLVKSWVAAHHNSSFGGVSFESSSMHVEPIGTPSEVTSKVVFVAERKHAGYWSDAACDSGAHGTDNCDTANSIFWQLTYANAGELNAHQRFQAGAVLPYPGESPSHAASASGQSYQFWGEWSFADSTAYREVASKGHMRWDTNCTLNQVPSGDGAYQCF